MHILVTGGAGYIGSFMVKRLLDDGYTVTVVDNLERGNKEVVDQRVNLQVGNILDKQFLSEVFAKDTFDAIIHFAGYIAVGESMQDPALYFDNNTFATAALLEEARKHNITKFIFSSTAAVYGDPIKTPIPEDHPKNPTSVYGESKLMVETLLNWYHKIYGINFVGLRYFNACGGALDGSMGENHDPETHIIPRAILSLMENKPFTLFGTDYKTPDGTCVRDYIHVLDLVEAHILALKKLQNDTGGFIYNVGTGKGFSNREVLDMVRQVTGIDLSVQTAPRRPGDADTLIADATKITTELQFVPQHSDLQTIVTTAWSWHKRHGA